MEMRDIIRQKPVAPPSDTPGHLAVLCIRDLGGQREP